MKDIKAYQCEFCKGLFQSQFAAEVHHDICIHNPCVHTCLNCLWRGHNFDTPEIPCLIHGFANLDKTGQIYYGSVCRCWRNEEYYAILQEYDGPEFEHNLIGYIKDARLNSDLFWLDVNAHVFSRQQQNRNLKKHIDGEFDLNSIIPPEIA